MSRRGPLAIALLVAGGACKPDLGADRGLVTSPRVLAIQAEPPEARPGVAATYTAFLAAPPDAGTGAVVWRFCTAPRTVGEDNVVSPGCFDAASLLAAGTGPSIDAATPAGGCAVFGPETTSGTARPPDPDGTGGYYQPLRVDWAGADPAFYLARIRCDLAGAPADVASEFARQYVNNANPHLLPIVATRAGARLVLDAAWPAADAETYAYFDRASQALVTRREAMRVAWYATVGSFDTGSTGRAADDPATSSSNTWTAPAGGPAPSGTRLWIVLRDDRGGVDVATYDVDR